VQQTFDVETLYRLENGGDVHTTSVLFSSYHRKIAIIKTEAVLTHLNTLL
jgi:hypothetical protein